MHSILIVEDDPLLLDMMRDYFLYKKFKVMTTNTAGSAIKIIPSHNFDFVITDMQLEERNSGQKILEYIKEKQLCLTVVLCTGHYEDLKAAKKFTAFSYLKPIDLDIIFADISEEFNKK